MNLSLRNENDKYETGEKIRRKRMALGLSQDELADRLGTDGNSVSRHENGTREMKLSVFCQYAEALRTDPSELLPDRLSAHRQGSLARLTAAAADLSEQDLALLLMMAERMKTGTSK